MMGHNKEKTSKKVHVTKVTIDRVKVIRETLYHPINPLWLSFYKGKVLTQ